MRRERSSFLVSCSRKAWCNIRCMLDWAALGAHGATSAKASGCWGQCTYGGKYIIASLQSVFDQDRMYFTTVASIFMMRLVQWLARKSFQCPGLLEDKFIVIILKQNRPHNIINA